MDVEALKVKADSGDKNAMLYFAKKHYDNNDFFEADKWYSKATENGCGEALYYAIAIKYTLGYEYMQNLPKIDAYCIAQWKEKLEWSLKWYAQFKNELDTEANVNVLKKIENIKYGLALSYTFSDGYDKAIELLKHMNDIRSSILYGISIVELDSEDETNWRIAYKKLSVIIDNSKYGNTPKGIWEEVAYAFGAFVLSEIFYDGLDDLPPSKEKGDEVLNFVIRFLKEDLSLSTLIKESRIDIDTIIAEAEKDNENKQNREVLCVTCGKKFNTRDGFCPFCHQKIEEKTSEESLKVDFEKYLENIVVHGISKDEFNKKKRYRFMLGVGLIVLVLFFLSVFLIKKILN